MNTFKNIAGFTLLSGIPCIDPAAIKTIDGYNVRDAFSPETDAADAQLVENMRANGFIADKPVTVRVINDVAYVIAGHRRVDAANWLNAEYVTANAPKGKVSEKAMKALTANRPIRGVTFIPEAMAGNGEVRSSVEMSYDLELSNTGKPLAPGERGANILRLRAMGEDDATIAKRLGITTRWVADLAKLGRSDPRLRALVKAGVIPPTTAILLERAHGAMAGTAVAMVAAGLAKAEGKASATGKHVAKAEIAAGLAPKVGGKNKKGADQRATDKPVTVTVAPAKPAATGKPGVTVGTLAGPFHLGKDLEERTLYDANGVALCEMVDVGMARAMLQLAMLGWGVLKGTTETQVREAEATLAKAVLVKPVPPVADVAAIAKAKADADTAKATREAERVARVAAQVLAADVGRVAAAKANRDAAAALGAGKPLAALAKASATKAKANAKAAADAALAALAKAEAEEAEAAALAEAEAKASAKASKASKASVATVVAAKANAAKANGKAKPAVGSSVYQPAAVGCGGLSFHRFFGVSNHED